MSVSSMGLAFLGFFRICDMHMAVISDIHANLEALREVLADIDRSHVDSTVSLGDNVGYGPNPKEVLELLDARGIPSIIGNHELGLIDSSSLSWFNPSARRSLEITAALLSASRIASFQTLQRRRVSNGCLCVHGCPPDSPLAYLFDTSDDELYHLFQRMDQGICFVGHTHELVLVAFDGDKVRRETVREGRMHLADGKKYIINTGSVGQPRDGDNRAKYVTWDDRSRIMEVRSVPYDVAVVARKIMNLGFPRENANRLYG